MVNTLSIEDIKGIVREIGRIMDENRDRLIEIDGQMGDGDLGITMAKGFAAARAETEQTTETEPGKLLTRVGATIARTAPSTMGTLVASGFMAGAKVVSGADAIDLVVLAGFFKAFVEAIMQRGKAKPGEKTAVDVLLPAAEAIGAAADAGMGLAEGMERCYAAAQEGLARTKDMIAQHGRPAYYQEQSRGKEDPGAAAGILIVQGFRDWICRPPQV